MLLIFGLSLFKSAALPVPRPVYENCQQELTRKFFLQLVHSSTAVVPLKQPRLCTCERNRHECRLLSRNFQVDIVFSQASEKSIAVHCSCTSLKFCLAERGVRVEVRGRREDAMRHPDLICWTG